MPGFENIEQDELRVFVDHWHESRGDALLPLRANLQPSRMRQALPYLILVEILPHPNVCVRLVGSEIERRMGGHLKPKDIVSDPGVYPTTQYFQNIRTVAKHPCGSFIRSVERYADGNLTEAAGLSLPYTDEDGATSYVVTVTVPVDAQTARLDPGSGPVEAGWKEQVYLDIGAGAPPSIGPQETLPTEFPWGTELAKSGSGL